MPLQDLIFILISQRGGRTIYAGPLGKDSRDLIGYFEGIPGVAAIREEQAPGGLVQEPCLAARVSEGPSSSVHRENEAHPRDTIELRRPAPARHALAPADLELV